MRQSWDTELLISSPRNIIHCPPGHEVTAPDQGYEDQSGYPRAGHLYHLHSLDQDQGTRRECGEDKSEVTGPGQRPASTFVMPAAAAASSRSQQS